MSSSSSSESIIYEGCMAGSKSSNNTQSSITEERLARKFQYALSLTIEKYMASIKYSMFKESYREIHDMAPDALEDIFDQFRAQSLSTIKEDVCSVYTEHNILPLLSSLEKLKRMNSKNYSNKMSWRPSGFPEEDVRDHFHISKEEHKDKLNDIRLKLCSQNKELENTMYKNHEEILAIKRWIEDLNQKIMEKLDDLRISTE